MERNEVPMKTEPLDQQTNDHSFLKQNTQESNLTVKMENADGFNGDTIAEEDEDKLN